MAVIVTQNLSSVKVKFDQGTDINGDRIYKTKTYSSINYDATNDNVVSVVNAIVDLQDHDLSTITRIDSSSLSE